MPNVYLSEDYLVRLISQAVAALHIIAGLRAAQKYREAEQQVDEALEGQLGLRASLLKELDDERLKEMLTTNGTLEMERFLLVADLFRESAELAQLRGDETGWRRDGQRALGFYQEAAQSGGIEVDEALPGKIAALKAALDGEAKAPKADKSTSSEPGKSSATSSRGIKRRTT
jgi:hypothetical protein